MWGSEKFTLWTFLGSHKNAIFLLPKSRSQHTFLFSTPYTYFSKWEEGVYTNFSPLSPTLDPPSYCLPGAGLILPDCLSIIPDKVPPEVRATPGSANALQLGRDSGSLQTSEPVLPLYFPLQSTWGFKTSCCWLVLFWRSHHSLLLPISRPLLCDCCP